MHCSKPASSRRSNQSPKHFEKTGSPRDISRKVFLPSGVAFDRLLRTLSSGKQGFAYRRARISIAVRSSRAQHPFETPSLSASVDDVDEAIGGRCAAIATPVIGPLRPSCERSTQRQVFLSQVQRRRQRTHV
jgi:hypothetical protein